MARNILSVLLLLIEVTTMCSQPVTLNWIFFVNGKIPEAARCSIIISGDDASDTVPCKYQVGEFIVSEDNYDKILVASECIMVLEIIFDEISPFPHNQYLYPIAIRKSYLTMSNSSYLIFNIHNISVRKRKFYIEIIGEGFKITPPYHRSQSMYNVFYDRKTRCRHSCSSKDIIRMNKVP